MDALQTITVLPCCSNNYDHTVDMAYKGFTSRVCLLGSLFQPCYKSARLDINRSC